jgi:hypothetical protein
MKTKFLFIILLTGYYSLVYSQNCGIDLRNLPQPPKDYSFSLLNKTFEQSKDCKIVFSDGLDTSKYKRITNKLTSWFLNDKTNKEFLFSSEVKEVDSNCQYLLIGLFNGFPNLKDYKFPIHYEKTNYSLGEIPINDKNDAIVIVNPSANVVAVLGNSFEAVESLTFRWLGYYDFYILKDKKIKFFGNLVDGEVLTDSIVNLDLIRKENYSQIIDNDFITARFSCKFNYPQRYQSTIDSLNNVFSEFSKFFKIGKTNGKLEYYIHNDPFELNIVSGSPKPGTTSGLVIDGLIHSVGMNIDLLTHEGIHFIFNKQINPINSFFNESVPSAYGLFLHPENIKNDSKLILNYLDYDFKALIIGKTDFWKGPYKNGQCLSYQISGLFVKYLINKWGIDKITEFLKSSDVTKGFEVTYKQQLDYAINDWKDWILTMSKN